MMDYGLAAYRDKRILLLQGPVGPFFWRLARDLRWAGAKVCKVNFNGGDWLFYPQGAITFRGKMNEWPEFFERLLRERNIDTVFFLGDCRPIHGVVQSIAAKHGVEVGVFEEGYIRPDTITFETSGVNGFSQIPSTPIYYLNNEFLTSPEPKPVGNTFPHVVLWAMLYYLASALLYPLFRHYRHHRSLSPLEALPWLKAIWRKVYHRFMERGMEQRLSSQWSGNFFLVPLQVHADAQVRVHSPYASIKDFIRQVIESFAAEAPASTMLVIKHHPLDRGYQEYGPYIRQQAEALGIADRVMAIHDQHLPTLLNHARGVIVINSTVGFSSLHHGTPVKVCGKAIYDMQGLTFQGTLEAFWHAAAKERIDQNLYWRFRGYIIARTQLNGSFYKRMAIPGSYSGVVWKVRADSCHAHSSTAEALPV